jgi:hypothetical protein
LCANFLLSAPAAAAAAAVATCIKL